jgi:hypothetical protein
MANTLYDYGREAFLAGSMSWNAGTVYMSFVNNLGITQGTAASSTATAGYKSTINSYGGGTSSYLLGTGGTTGALAYGTVTAGLGVGVPTVGSGIAGASDTTVNSVPAGGTIGAIVLWTPATINGVGSPLLAWIDTAASGLPIVPNGGNVTVSWSRGTNLIFKL